MVVCGLLDWCHTLQMQRVQPFLGSLVVGKVIQSLHRPLLRHRVRHGLAVLPLPEGAEGQICTGVCLSERVMSRLLGIGRLTLLPRGGVKGMNERRINIRIGRVRLVTG